MSRFNRSTFFKPLDNIPAQHLKQHITALNLTPPSCDRKKRPYTLRSEPISNKSPVICAVYVELIICLVSVRRKMFELMKCDEKGRGKKSRNDEPKRELHVCVDTFFHS